MPPEVMDETVPAQPVDVPEPTDAEADADFAAGFDAPSAPAPTEPTASPAIVDPLESHADPDDVPAPEFVQLTKESHQQLLDGVAQIDTIKAALEERFGKVFGTMGGLQRTLKQIQDATPSGQAVELSNEDLKELAEDFPELTDKMLTGLNRAMSKLKGTGPAFDEAKMGTLIESRVQKIREDSALEVMDLVSAGWRDTVNSPEYREWLAAQPADYQAKINDTWSPSLMQGSITKFKEAQAAKPKASANARPDRFAAAVVPRGAGGHSPSTSEDDDFLAGFNGR